MLEGFLRIGPRISSDVIRIGVILPLSGNRAAEGLEIYEAYDVAREIVQERGGVNGKSIVFETRDSPTPELAKRNALELSLDKIPIVMGSLANDVGLAASEVIEREGGTYFETTAVSEEFTKDRGHVFRASTAGSKMGAIAIQFAAGYMQKHAPEQTVPTSIGIAYEDNWELIAQTARSTALLHKMRVAYFSSFESTPQGCARIVKDMRNAGVDIVLAGGWLNDAICLKQSAQQLGFHPKAWIGLSGGHGIDQFAECLGRDSNGVFVVNTSSAVPDSSLTKDGRELKHEVLRRWVRRRPGQTPSSLAWEAFCNAWVLMMEALPHARTVSANDVREALLRINLPEGSLPNGSGVLFDGNGANQNAFYTVKQWRNGELSTTWGAVYRMFCHSMTR